MRYTCGLCHEQIEGDLLTLKEHSEQHIVDLIRRDHPDWAGPDGVCRKCYEYYRSELAGTDFDPPEPRRGGMAGLMSTFRRFLKK